MPDGKPDPRYRAAGTRFRQATLGYAYNTAYPYQVDSQVFATGEWDISEFALFFPAFYNAPNGLMHEIATTAAMRIEGISFLIDGTWQTATIAPGDEIVDPQIDGAGKWVRLSGVTLPANTLIEMRKAFQFTREGTIPRDPAAASGESGRGGAASMASYLTTGSLNNTNSNAWRAAGMIAKGGDGRPSLVVVGDSIGAGADQYTSSAYHSPRAEFGYVALGLDDNTDTKRISSLNLCVPGQKPEAYANREAISKKLEMLAKAKALNGGVSPVDEIICQHGTNSINGSITTPALLGYLRGTIGNIRSVVGETVPATQIEMIAYPGSTDGYATVENQFHPSPQNVYPNGVRWQANAAIGGPDGLGDASAPLRADGTIQHSIAPWRYGSADTGNGRDKLKVLPFASTLAAEYASGSTVSLVNEPAVGDYLSFGAPGGSYHYAIVRAVSGSGPYTCDLVWQGGRAAKPAGTVVRATMHGGGLHPGPLAHVMYAQAILDYKRQRGWV